MFDFNYIYWTPIDPELQPVLPGSGQVGSKLLAWWQPREWRGSWWLWSGWIRGNVGWRGFGSQVHSGRGRGRGCRGWGCVWPRIPGYYDFVGPQLVSSASRVCQACWSGHAAGPKSWAIAQQGTCAHWKFKEGFQSACTLQRKYLGLTKNILGLSKNLTPQHGYIIRFKTNDEVRYVWWA